jgi:hypothetical protein
MATALIIGFIGLLLSGGEGLAALAAIMLSSIGAVFVTMLNVMQASHYFGSVRELKPKQWHGPDWIVAGMTTVSIGYLLYVAYILFIVFVLWRR